jgi:phosphopentomutase
MARACVIVLDAVGVGDLPDADRFGTAGSNTLGHVAEAVGGLDLPALQQLGLGNVLPLAGCPPRADAPAVWGRLVERSLGMDTTTGHWEMVGIITERPFPTFPDGFPQELIDRFSEATGRGVIGNVAASGTEIIERLGEQHQRTGDWIVYTSADSVFQVAAHEQVVPLEELYGACRTAREMLTGELAVGRVIARPFEGEPGSFVRTPRRHDFSLLPPRPNHLQRMRATGVAVHGVGKISDIFAGQDVDSSSPTESNGQGIARTIARLRDSQDGDLVFTNLVETDMIWGHRNDPAGFAECLREFDEELPRLMAALRHGDLLVLTSDHGCDPTTPSTDHSREHGLLLAHVVGRPATGRRHDGDTFADVGATVQRHLTGSHDADLPGTPVI